MRRAPPAARAQQPRRRRETNREITATRRTSFGRSRKTPPLAEKRRRMRPPSGFNGVGDVGVCAMPNAGLDDLRFGWPVPKPNSLCGYTVHIEDAVPDYQHYLAGIPHMTLLCGSPPDDFSGIRGPRRPAWFARGETDRVLGLSPPQNAAAYSEGRNSPVV